MTWLFYHSAVSHPCLSSLFIICISLIYRGIHHTWALEYQMSLPSSPPPLLPPPSSLLRYLTFNSEWCLVMLHIKSHDTWKLTVWSAFKKRINPDTHQMKVRYWQRGCSDALSVHSISHINKSMLNTEVISSLSQYNQVTSGSISQRLS